MAKDKTTKKKGSSVKALSDGSGSSPVALGEVKIEYFALDDLKPNDYNPNRQSEHDFSLLCKSIDEDGFTDPVIVLRDGLVIVDGEHRWRAARALGMSEVPCVLVNMSLAQAKIATLRHNRARGEENVELAASLLKDIARQGGEALAYMQDSLELDDVELKNFLDAVDDQDAFSLEQAAAIADADDAELKTMIAEEGGEFDENETASVQDVIRARERRIALAKSDEERAQVLKETSVYHLRLVFSYQQGHIIRSVLGDHRIERLLEICKDIASKMEAEGDLA